MTNKIFQICPLLGDKHEETITLNSTLEVLPNRFHKAQHDTILLWVLYRPCCCHELLDFTVASISNPPFHSCICLVKEPMSTSNKAFFTFTKTAKETTATCQANGILWHVANSLLTLCFRCPPGFRKRWTSNWNSCALYVWYPMKIQSKHPANLNSCWSVLNQLVLPGMFPQEFFQSECWSLGGGFQTSPSPCNLLP